MNYAEYDKNIRYYDDKLKIARSMGFNYVSEAWYELHKKGVKNSSVGNIFGMSKAGINYGLKRMGVKQFRRGGRNYSKLTEAQVREIRFIKKTHKYYIEKYGISDATIRDIRSRRTWVSVTDK